MKGFTKNQPSVVAHSRSRIGTREIDRSLKVPTCLLKVERFYSVCRYATNWKDALHISRKMIFLAVAIMYFSFLPGFYYLLSIFLV